MKYYELLEVAPNATAAQIKAAYRILVQLHHPDRLLQANPSVRHYAEEKLKRINEAYTVLSDPARRAAYDARQPRRRAHAEEGDEDDEFPRPRRARRPPRSPEDLERDADEILRRAAEQAAAERAAAQARARAVAAEQARRAEEERLRHQAQNLYPRAQASDQGFTVHFAPSVWTPFIRIPAGEFWMGSDPQRDPLAHAQEQPRHLVYLDDYAMGKYPVTNAQYAVFARMTRRAFTFAAGNETCPVTQVAWDDAVAFCAWLTHYIGRIFRLPTEAEWEKAARGADGRLYPWGDAWDTTRLNCGQPHLALSPVGHFSPLGDSPYGVADLSGNVWEWCADWFDARAYARRAAVTNGVARNPEVVRNPQGPSAGEGCVVRGGAFDSTPKQARSTHRNWFYPYNTRPNVGFRLVASLG